MRYGFGKRPLHFLQRLHKHTVVEGCLLDVGDDSAVRRSCFDIVLQLRELVRIARSRFNPEGDRYISRICAVDAACAAAAIAAAAAMAVTKCAPAIDSSGIAYAVYMSDSNSLRFKPKRSSHAGSEGGLHNQIGSLCSRQGEGDVSGDNRYFFLLRDHRIAFKSGVAGRSRRGHQSGSYGGDVDRLSREERFEIGHRKHRLLGVNRRFGGGDRGEGHRGRVSGGNEVVTATTAVNASVYGRIAIGRGSRSGRSGGSNLLAIASSVDAVQDTLSAIRDRTRFGAGWVRR